MQSTYSGKSNRTLEEDINVQVHSLVKLIRRKYLWTESHPRHVDFARLSQFFTMDVITKIAYGKAFGYLRDDEDKFDYLRTIERVVPFVAFCTSFPALSRLFDSTWAHRVAEAVVDERYGELSVTKSDMLGSFVQRRLPRRQMQAEVLFQITAGSETTATALRATLLHLITKPKYLEMLRGEIYSAIGAHLISCPISDADVKRLPFLQACVKEGLRIHLPFTGLLMKEVPPQGDVIHGVSVHARLYINQFAIQVPYACLDPLTFGMMALNLLSLVLFMKVGFLAAAQLPVFIVNNASGNDTINAYVTGLDLNNELVLLKPDGSWYYPDPAVQSSIPKSIAEDFAIRVGGKGTTTAINLTSDLLAGRIWISINSLAFFTVLDVGGVVRLVEPSVTDSSDPNASVKWGFIEFTYSKRDGVFANISYVDFICLSLGISLSSANGL
ncbi:uncharacterized protein TRUGW13939_09727 [Talaromyces rugulosus]|uniref:GH64 domain-containing protein n=1 Tax=Talaromyces rugulosus TaxID=121627 RepID=A0A7H8R8H1_TALRU|nr:uncharacterized protein TRUGW13939_09727 [Talaromyces rugulosus]QKX62566.1 hypothetical protein TRUGW13939_09727 [Talaromyces rugulosus]